MAAGRRLFVWLCGHPILNEISSWSSGLCPMAIFFSRMRRRSFRSVNWMGPNACRGACSRKRSAIWRRSRVEQVHTAGGMVVLWWAAWVVALTVMAGPVDGGMDCWAILSDSGVSDVSVAVPCEMTSVCSPSRTAPSITIFLMHLNSFCCERDWYNLG